MNGSCGKERWIEALSFLLAVQFYIGLDKLLGDGGWFVVMRINLFDGHDFHGCAAQEAFIEIAEFGGGDGSYVDFYACVFGEADYGLAGDAV